MNANDAYLVMTIKQDDRCLSGSFQNRNFLEIPTKKNHVANALHRHRRCDTIV